MVLCPICDGKSTDFYCRKNLYIYYLCNSCDTLFLHPLPNSQFINRLYKKEFDYKTGLTEEKRIRRQSSGILQKLRKLNPEAKSLLDIGSGYGFFLDEAKNYGLKLFGLEPADILYSYSKNNFKGINLYNSDFETFYNKSFVNKFDFIILNHVIEHIVHPQKTIRQVIELLKPKGILYIETPNLNSHLFKVQKENYTFLTPPEHLWIFSSKSFQQIFQKSQSSVKLSFDTYSYPEHLMGIIKKKLKIKNDKFKILKENKNESNKQFPISKFKYLLFDRLIAPIFTPLLNINYKGSILQLYIKKNLN